MSLVNLSELKSRKRPRRASKMIEKLETLMNEQLTIRELVTALGMQPNVSASYDKGDISLSYGEEGSTVKIRFLAGTALSVEFPFPLELDEEELAELIKEFSSVPGVENILPDKENSLVVVFDPSVYTAELAAAVLAKLTSFIFEERTEEEGESERVPEPDLPE